MSSAETQNHGSAPSGVAAATRARPPSTSHQARAIRSEHVARREIPVGEAKLRAMATSGRADPLGHRLRDHAGQQRRPEPLRDREAAKPATRRDAVRKRPGDPNEVIDGALIEIDRELGADRVGPDEGGETNGRGVPSEQRVDPAFVVEPGSVKDLGPVPIAAEGLHDPGPIS